jgi:hypothetical protein
MAYAKQADPTRMKAVPSKAVKIRKMKNAARLGARAVPILHPQNSTAVAWLIRRLPYTSESGPQTMGDMPIMSMYMALVMFTIEPVVPYSAATSGVAARTLVLEMGARKEQNDISTTMPVFLWAEKRS